MSSSQSDNVSRNPRPAQELHRRMSNIFQLLLYMLHCYCKYRAAKIASTSLSEEQTSLQRYRTCLFAEYSAHLGQTVTPKRPPSSCSTAKGRYCVVRVCIVDCYNPIVVSKIKNQVKIPPPSRNPTFPLAINTSPFRRRDSTCPQSARQKVKPLPLRYCARFCRGSPQADRQNQMPKQATPL